jgi:hypothetical protein
MIINSFTLFLLYILVVLPVLFNLADDIDTNGVLCQVALCMVSIGAALAICISDYSLLALGILCRYIDDALGVMAAKLEIKKHAKDKIPL